MDRVGVLVISKCLSASAMVDTFLRSESYNPEFYIVEKQDNPYNKSKAREHTVVPDLSLGEIVKFARRFRNRIDFGLTDNEDFVVAGGRDVVEKEAGVPILCVTKEYAVERSKAEQRVLFEDTFPEANPLFKVFDPKEYPSPQDALSDFRKFASGREVVVKPDAPARGAGVGVWGSDFHSKAEMSTFFLNALSKGRVVAEEKVEGEESSFHAFSDGRHFVAAPLTRDYKRGVDGNRGKLTGGMGSYRGSGPRLPFVGKTEWERLASAEERAFRRWKGRGSRPGLRGIVLYDAIMHTGNGFRVLERNSRGGNTEVVNLLTTVADDMIDVCHRILDGTLKRIRFRTEASVVTCAVPRNYGLDAPLPSQPAPVRIADAYELSRRSEGRIRIFPMDVREEDGVSFIGASRTVAVAGLGATTDEARDLSLQGIAALSGSLRWRTDIASTEDIGRSTAHLKALRLASA